MTQAAVTVRGVGHSFGHGENRKQVLFDNHLTLLAGELVIMTGPSGSGKTTLLTLIGALRTIQEGTIEILGRQLAGLGARQLTQARRDIGFIFQAHNLFESLTAHQNVRMSMELHSIGNAEKKKRATEVLCRLGLADRQHYKPRHLSGGQRQRVAVARALVNHPRLILADEPTAALDKDSGREVIDLLKELAITEGSTVLVVTHDARIIDTADRIVNMVDGYVSSETLVEETVTICEFLARCSLFDQEGLRKFETEDREEIVLPNSPQLLTSLAEHMRRDQYPDGAMIFDQGSAGDRFYIVRSGAVEVVVEEAGKSQVVATLRVGDYFGEAALLRDEPRNAGIRCIGESSVYSLDKQDFLRAMRSATTLSGEIRSTLFGRTRAT